MGYRRAFDRERPRPGSKVSLIVAVCGNHPTPVETEVVGEESHYTGDETFQSPEPLEADRAPKRSDSTAYTRGSLACDVTTKDRADFEKASSPTNGGKELSLVDVEAAGKSQHGAINAQLPLWYDNPDAKDVLNRLLAKRSREFLSNLGVLDPSDRSRIIDYLNEFEYSVLTKLQHPLRDYDCYCCLKWIEKAKAYAVMLFTPRLGALGTMEVCSEKGLLSMKEVFDVLHGHDDVWETMKRSQSWYGWLLEDPSTFIDIKRFPDHMGKNYVVQMLDALSVLRSKVTSDFEMEIDCLEADGKQAVTLTLRDRGRKTESSFPLPLSVTGREIRPAQWGKWVHEVQFKGVEHQDLWKLQSTDMLSCLAEFRRRTIDAISKRDNKDEIERLIKVILPYGERLIGIAPHCRWPTMETIYVVRPQKEEDRYVVKLEMFTHIRDGYYYHELSPKHSLEVADVQKLINEKMNLTDFASKLKWDGVIWGIGLNENRYIRLLNLPKSNRSNQVYELLTVLSFILEKRDGIESARFDFEAFWKRHGASIFRNRSSLGETKLSPQEWRKLCEKIPSFKWKPEYEDEWNTLWDKSKGLKTLANSMPVQKTSDLMTRVQWKVGVSNEILKERLEAEKLKEWWQHQSHIDKQNFKALERSYSGREGGELIYRCVELLPETDEYRVASVTPLEKDIYLWDIGHPVKLSPKKVNGNSQLNLKKELRDRSVSGGTKHVLREGDTEFGVISGCPPNSSYIRTVTKILIFLRRNLKGCERIEAEVTEKGSQLQLTIIDEDGRNIASPELPGPMATSTSEDWKRSIEQTEGLQWNATQWGVIWPDAFSIPHASSRSTLRGETPTLEESNAREISLSEKEFKKWSEEMWDQLSKDKILAKAGAAHYLKDSGLAVLGLADPSESKNRCCCLEWIPAEDVCRMTLVTYVCPGLYLWEYPKDSNLLSESTLRDKFPTLARTSHEIAKFAQAVDANDCCRTLHHSAKGGEPDERSSGRGGLPARGKEFASISSWSGPLTDTKINFLNALGILRRRLSDFHVQLEVETTDQIQVRVKFNHKTDPTNNREFSLPMSDVIENISWPQLLHENAPGTFDVNEENDWTALWRIDSKGGNEALEDTTSHDDQSDGCSYSQSSEAEGSDMATIEVDPTAMPRSTALPDIVKDSLRGGIEEWKQLNEYIQTLTPTRVKVEEDSDWGLRIIVESSKGNKRLLPIYSGVIYIEDLLERKKTKDLKSNALFGEGVGFNFSGVLVLKDKRVSLDFRSLKDDPKYSATMLRAVAFLGLNLPSAKQIAFSATRNPRSRKIEVKVEMTDSGRKRTLQFPLPQPGATVTPQEWRTFLMSIQELNWNSDLQKLWNAVAHFPDLRISPPLNPPSKGVRR